jgi:Domain of unknown function (DUF4864)
VTAWLGSRGEARRWAGRGLLYWWLAGLLVPTTVAAAALAEADARAVRSVVQAQLDAFAADDAERAFSYASKSIRAQFGDALSFMAMVRAGYPMVMRPASVVFFLPRLDGGAVRQSVQLRDGAGRLWLATYQLARQAGAGWRIHGCVVVPDSGKSST